MRTFAPHLKITEVSNRCFSGCSAVGSVPGLGPGCRRFESCHPDFHLKTTFPKSIRGVAQLVAFLVWDQAVAGSSPVTPTKVHQFTRLMDFSFYLIPASQKKNAIHISELRYIYILKFPVGIMLYAVRNYAGVFLISK